MKAGGLVEIFRNYVDDIDKGTSANLLWKDPEVLQYIDFAQKEAARRAKLIEDNTTSSVCSITLSPNQSLYSIHSSILRMSEAVLSSTGAKLSPTNHRDLDFVTPTWRTTAGSGNVAQYVMDWGARKIRFYETPLVVDSVQLSVVRLPLNEVNDKNDDLELSDDWCYKLLPGMCWMAYGKKDTQTEDPNLRRRYEEEFIRNFGHPISAQIELEFQKSYANRRRTRSCF